MKRLLFILFLVGAAVYLLAPPRAVPVSEEKKAVAQAGGDIRQRADGPLRSSWGSTLKSLRQKPDTTPASQETGSYRQAAAYKKRPDPAQTNSGRITNTGDLTGSIDKASTTRAGALDGEDTGWARITLAATLRREASVSSPIVGYSRPGKEVQIRDYANGWFRVRDPDTHEGGWIFHKYVAYIHGPTPADAQVAATAEPSVKVASPTSRKPTRIAKPAVRASNNRKVAKRHDRNRRIAERDKQRNRVAERGERRRWFGLFKRREARQAWSFGPAH